MLFRPCWKSNHMTCLTNLFFCAILQSIKCMYLIECRWCPVHGRDESSLIKLGDDDGISRHITIDTSSWNSSLTSRLRFSDVQGHLAEGSSALCTTTTYVHMCVTGLREKNYLRLIFTNLFIWWPQMVSSLFTPKVGKCNPSQPWRVAKHRKWQKGNYLPMKSLKQFPINSSLIAKRTFQNWFRANVG